MSDEKPTTVVEAIAAVMRELPAIGKSDHSEQGYNYRGIEAITQHAETLFGKYCVVPAARVVERRTVQLTINSRPWTQEELAVVYRLYGPSHNKLRPRRVLAGNTVVEIDEVIEDWIDVGPIWGLGRDNSDKGSNKSLTQAFKYGLIQTLVIGDKKDDGDNERAHEADAPVVVLDPHKQARVEAAARLRSLSPRERDTLRTFCDEHDIPRVPAQWDDEQLETVTEVMDRIELEGVPSDEVSPTSGDGGNPATEGEEGDRGLVSPSASEDETRVEEGDGRLITDSRPALGAVRRGRG